MTYTSTQTPSVLVSIVMPTYNASAFVSESIEAIMAQTYTNWELLVVDDCSTDNTAEIVRRYVAQDARIKLLETVVNSGAAVSRNRATEVAKGEYIAFCDSDDCWDACKLTVQVAFMQQSGSLMSYHNYRVINLTGNVLRSRVSPPQIRYRDMVKRCEMGCLTVMYNCKELGKMYMPNIRRRQDWGLWLTILKRIPHADGINQEMASYRVGHSSISSNKRKLIAYYYLIFREQEGFTTIRSLFYTVRFLFLHIIRLLKREL